MAEIRKSAPDVHLQPDVLANYNHTKLPHHPQWGQGIRFRIGGEKGVVVDVFPAPISPDLTPTVTLRGSPNERGRRTKTEIPGVSEVMPTVDLEPVTGYGLYVMASNDEVLINSNGRFYHRHFVDASEPLRMPVTMQLAATIAELRARRGTGTPQETQQEGKEKQPRVKVTGFFGKVLDTYPQQTEEGKTIYKLLLGKKVIQDETEKIAWTVVTVLEPHVVQFLEQNLPSFEKRKTMLRAEGYYQEVEIKLKKGIKKTQELYALNIVRIK